LGRALLKVFRFVPERAGYAARTFTLVVECCWLEERSKRCRR